MRIRKKLREFKPLPTKGGIFIYKLQRYAVEKSCALAEGKINTYGTYALLKTVCPMCWRVFTFAVPPTATNFRRRCLDCARLFPLASLKGSERP